MISYISIHFEVCVYCSHYNKAIEMSNLHSPICFVAEVFEPFILRQNKKEIEYSDMSQEEIKDFPDLKKMKRRIVGTVSVKNHQSLYESAWIYRLGKAFIDSRNVDLFSKQCVFLSYLFNSRRTRLSF